MSKNLLSAISSKNNTVTKDKESKEKEEEHDNTKTPNSKAKIMDKLKTTAKIKRPVISLKPNTNANSKINTTGYETNVTSSSKSPLASNFASEKPHVKAEKKTKESKDDSNIKHKKPLDNNPEAGKLDKTHRVEKKTNSNSNVTDDSEAKNLVNNLAAKKSSNKIATSNPTSKKNSDKNNANSEKINHAEPSNENQKKKKDSDKKSNENLKDKKETKTNPKLASSKNFFNLFFII